MLLHLSLVLLAFLPAIGGAVLGKVLSVAGAVVLAPLTYLIGRAVLNAHAAIDDLSPFGKRVIVFVLALVVSIVYQFLGQQLPAECVGVGSGDISDACWGALSSPTALRGVAAALVAMFLHSLKKASPSS